VEEMRDWDTQVHANYLGELYLGDSADAAAAKADRAALELARERRAVRHLRTIFVPADELCLHLFEADSEETVGEVGRRAATPFDRVLAAREIQIPTSEGRRE
jgi:hypothetical protein